MSAWFGDVRVSLRHLRRSPGFALAAVVVLALGIGLNAAMFGLIYALGFAGRGFAGPEAIVQLYSSRTDRPDSYRAFSYPAFEQIAASTEVFSGVLAHRMTLVGVSTGGDARRTFAAIVSRNYFDVLGVPLIEGRAFTAEEARPGDDIPVVVASYAYWQRTGRDPELVGSTVRINERAFTIIGITPEGFTGTMSVFGPELFFPFGVFHSMSDDVEGDRRRTLLDPGAYNVFVVARLADGLGADAAAERLTLAGAQLERAFPAEYEKARVTLAPLPRFGTSTSPSDESVLGVLAAVLMGLTAAVLLTVCLNLAAMLMARGRARRKELAIRLALGGGRGRIVRQLLIEGFLLALAGGIGGVLIGTAALDAIVAAFRAALPISIVLGSTVSPALMIATLCFALLATLWFALVPALRHSRPEILPDLKPHATDDVRDRRHPLRPRHPLLVAQVSLSVALLIAAGLFVRMAYTALSVDFGFRADDTVLAEVDARLGGYDTPQMLDVYATATQRLEQLPGVESAAVGAIVPLGLVNIGESVRRAGINVPEGVRPQSPQEGQAFSAVWNGISGGYFDAMGVPLLRGRTFTDTESFSAGAPPVAILDEALARRLWPDGAALGQFVEIVRSAGSREPVVAMAVVGIVRSTRRQLFEREFPGSLYVPFAHRPQSNAFFHVRPFAGQAALTEAVRKEIRAAAPNLPLFSAQTYRSHVNASVEHWALQLTAALFSGFGGLAMLVALVGIYGVLSYVVERRTREIGIRMAIGATARGVRRMIVGEGLALTLLGVAVGCAIGIGVGQLLSSIFVDLAAFDLLVFTAVPVAFIGAALIAAWLPARRATRIDPLGALRAA